MFFFFPFTPSMDENRSWVPQIFLVEWLRIDQIQRGMQFSMQEKVFRSQMQYC